MESIHWSWGNMILIFERFTAHDARHKGCYMMIPSWEGLGVGSLKDKS